MEEDLAKVGDNGSAVFVKDQDTMPTIALTQHIRHANIALYLIMK